MKVVSLASALAALSLAPGVLAQSTMAPSAPPPPAPAAPKPSSAAVVEIPGPEPRVLVALDGPRGAALMRQNEFGWGSVCHAPCRARLPRSEEYKVLVPGWKPTSTFDLDDSAGALRLDVTPANDSTATLGQVLGYVGAAAIIGGLITVLVADSKTGDAVGFAIAGTGAVSVGIGIPLAISGSKSNVEQVPVSRPAQGLSFRGVF
jgi:hypothetical protein